MQCYVAAGVEAIQEGRQIKGRFLEKPPAYLRVQDRLREGVLAMLAHYGKAKRAAKAGSARTSFTQGLTTATT